MKEIWRDITGYEGKYQISSDGRVKSMNYNHKGRAKILKPTINNTGYKKVNLYNNGKAKIVFVHRLVAEAFIPNPNNMPVVNHKDENKLNNQVDNLEWCTIGYNVTYGTAIDRRIEKTSKKVAQYNEDGSLVKIWKNTKEVNQWYKTNPTSIAKVCKGEKDSYYGYIWKYI